MPTNPIPHRGTLPPTSVLPHTPLASDPTAAEALRRVHAQPAHDARRVLATVADRLSTQNPSRPMDHGALLVIAHRAADPCGTGRCALLRTADTARAQAPEILPGETRGEYAVRLRMAAREVRL